MPARDHVYDEARRSAMRLIDVIQTAAGEFPRVIIAIDLLLRTFRAEDRRRGLAQRLARLDETELAAVDAMIAALEQERREDPAPPLSTAGMLIDLSPSQTPTAQRIDHGA